MPVLEKIKELFAGAQQEPVLDPGSMLKDARPIERPTLPAGDQAEIDRLDAEAKEFTATYDAAKLARQDAEADLRALEKKAQRAVANPTLTVSGLHAVEQDEALQNACRRWTPVAEQAVHDAEKREQAARGRLLVNRSQRARLMAEALGRLEQKRMAAAAAEKVAKFDEAKAAQVIALKRFLEEPVPGSAKKAERVFFSS